MRNIRTELPDGCYHIRYHNGKETWYNHKGEYHRIDGPAVIRRDGYQMYCLNDLIHRTDGPAIIRPDGSIEYYVDDEIPKTILDIVIADQDFDFESFPSAVIVTNYRSASWEIAYQISDPDELILAILQYG